MDAADFNLSHAEAEVVGAAASGREADLTDWEDRAVRAEVVRQLCVGGAAWPVAAKGVRVRGATIAGVLDLESAEVAHPLRLVACEFSETLVIAHASTHSVDLANSKLPGVDAVGATVTGDLLLGGGTFYGELALRSADIRGQLSCTGAQLEAGAWLNADLAVVKGGVFLDKSFKSTGSVRLEGATIGGQLNCSQATMTNGAGLIADRASIVGGVFLDDGFATDGTVSFHSAKLGGQFNCTNGIFTGAATALILDDAEIAGPVYLNDQFSADGEVRLHTTQIGGDLHCSGGEFRAARSLVVDNSAVAGNLLLNDRFESKGEVSLHSAKVGQNLRIENAELKGSVVIANARVVGTFTWRAVSGHQPSVELAGTAVGVLRDAPSAWSTTGEIRLAGFAFEKIDPESDGDLQTRLAWLDRSGYNPGLYRQVASHYQAIGQGQTARKVLIHQQVRRREAGDIAKGAADDRREEALNWLRRAWSRFLGFTVAHGHRPWQALGLMVALIGLAAIVFEIGFAQDFFIAAGDAPPTAGECTPDFRCFHAAAYAVDTVVPILDLGQQGAWRPDASQSGGAAIRYFVWFCISAGWLMTTSVVAGVTSVLRPE